ncbi:MAG: PIN domain-containing protein [marine benthic group bacterium]|nr:PIN domain-containing protein [Candidatus Benthicola marisminoris]
MIAYLDASVLLRVILGQPERLPEWPEIDLGVGSALLEVECLRALDRLRIREDLSPEDLAARREVVYRLTAEMEVVEPNWPVLRRAGQPFPTPLGTLDAVHLATALLWRDSRGQDLVLATHDRALALAARASGLTAIGA